jgi:hypothetical protein
MPDLPFESLIALDLHTGRVRVPLPKRAICDDSFLGNTEYVELSKDGRRFAFMCKNVAAAYELVTKDPGSGLSTWALVDSMNLEVAEARQNPLRN